MSKIIYTDKVNNSLSGLAANKKVSDDDMNEIKTVVNANDDNRINLQAELDTLEALAGAVPLMYEYDDTVVEADPGAGKFRFDFINHLSASDLFISKEDKTLDTLGLWGLVSVGSYIYIKTREDLQGGGLYVVGTITDNGTWFKFGIAAVDGGTLTTGDICAVQMFIPAVAGSGDVATDSIWDAKGDLVAATGNNTATKVTIGANKTRLEADSTVANGVKWSGDPLQFAMALSDENITDLTASTSVPVWSKYSAVDFTLTSATFDAITAPVGASILVDIHRNGSTILTTRASIASAANISTSLVVASGTFSTGDLIEIFVDQIGSTTAGKGLKGDLIGVLR